MPVQFAWSAVTIDCADPARLATFWQALLGGEVSEPLPGWRRVTPDGTPSLTFQPVPERARDKVRLHLDLEVDDVDIAAARVRELGGAGPHARVDHPGDGVVVHVSDPEGTVFCLVAYDRVRTEGATGTGRTDRTTGPRSRT